MKRIILILLIIFSITSCADVLNNLTSGNSDDSSSSSSSSDTQTAVNVSYAPFSGTTWNTSSSESIDTISFGSDGTYAWTQNDLTSANADFIYKGTYSVSGNEVTLTSLSYARCKTGTPWRGSCAITKYMNLVNGTLYFSVQKRSSTGSSIIDTWTSTQFKVYYDPDNLYSINGVSAVTVTRTFSSDGTISENISEEFIYNKTASQKNSKENDSGTYTIAGNDVTVVYKSDNSTSKYIVADNYICYTGKTAYMASLTTPSGLTIVSTGSNYVSLSWDGVTGATGYKVYYGTSSSTSGMTFAGSTIENSYIVTKLSAVTKYYFSIIAFNNYTTSTYSFSVSATTSKITATAPENVVFTSSSSNFTSYKNLGWDLVDSAQKYKIYMIGPSFSEIS